MRIKNRWVSIKFIRILLTRPNDTSRVIYHRLCSTLSCSLINHNLSPFPLPSHHQEASRKLPKKRFPSRHNNIAIRRALRSNLTSTFHPHPTLSEWKKKKKTTGAIIKKCTTTIFEVSHSVVHPTLKTVYFLQTPNEKQQKKKKEAEWNNVNNRIPQQTTFFSFFLPRSVYCWCSGFGSFFSLHPPTQNASYYYSILLSGESFSLPPFASLFAMAEEKIILLPTFSHDMKTRFHSGFEARARRRRASG